MSEQFFVKELPNGMTLLGQKMEGVASAAMCFAFRSGSSYDPDTLAGSASIGAEWLMRGAGDRDSRGLNDALDALGCHHSESVQSEHITLTASLLGRNLPALLEIYADIVRRPRLEEATFEPCQQLIMQDLQGLEDEPARKCNYLLRERFFPYPLGRHPYGTEQTLQAISADSLRGHMQTHLSPAGAILAIAGNFEWDELCGNVEKCFGDWTGQPAAALQLQQPTGGVNHITKDSAQIHICLAHKAAVTSDKHYYAARMAETVLSRGMGSRLFTEVREKRGLVYHVSSSYSSLKKHAGMFTYAGTKPECAQETMNITIGELRRLAEGIADEELSRGRTQLRSALVMQGESTAARAASICGDWYHLGQLRGLEEISSKIDAVTEADVIAYLKEYPANDFTVLTIGPEPLEVPS